jgi:hypothetical protein
MTWPRRPEHGHVGAHLLAVVAVLLALCAPAAAQAPDPAPPAAGPAPDPAPQAADPAQAPPPAAPAPAVEPPAPAPTSGPATQPVPAPAAQPRRESGERRERAKRRRAAGRPRQTRSQRRPPSFGATTIPASVLAPRLVIERSAPLATAEARLAALALLVAAAGSLGLIGHLRRETLG